MASYTSDAAKADLLDLIRVPQERTFGIPSANLVHLSPIANKAFMTCSVRTQNYSAIRYMSLNILPRKSCIIIEVNIHCVVQNLSSLRLCSLYLLVLSPF